MAISPRECCNVLYIRGAKPGNESSLIRKKVLQMNLAEVEKNFATLVDKVYREGISIDLERDDKVVARLTPAQPHREITLGELNAFLANLPSLGEDTDRFSEDVRAIRAAFPAEASPWD